MSKKIVIIIALVTTLIGGGVGAAWWFGYLDFGKMLGTEEGEVEPEIVLDDEPSFFPLEEFIISLKQPGNARFMQIEISLMSHDPRMEDQVKELDSVIRNTMLQYFSGRDQSDIQTEMGDIEAFQSSLKVALVDAAKAYSRPFPVERVLLTNVIVQ